MGGYNSGRSGSDQPCIEDFHSLDTCSLYREGMLEPGAKSFLKFSDGYPLKLEYRTQFWGWDQCLFVRYPVINGKGKMEIREQALGIEMVDVLNGKAKRPYFVCPKLEKRVGKLILGDRGFAHRSYYGYQYRVQRQGHIDRALTAARKIQEKLGCVDGYAATDEPDRPKGMHRRTFVRYLRRHQNAIAPLRGRFGDMF